MMDSVELCSFCILYCIILFTIPEEYQFLDFNSFTIIPELFSWPEQIGAR